MRDLYHGGTENTEVLKLLGDQGSAADACEKRGPSKKAETRRALPFATGFSFRSLTYVITGTTNLINFVGSPPALSPSLTGPHRTTTVRLPIS